MHHDPSRMIPTFVVYVGTLAFVVGLLSAWGTDFATIALVEIFGRRVTTGGVLLMGALGVVISQTLLIWGWQRFAQGRGTKARESDSIVPLPPDRRQRLQVGQG